MNNINQKLKELNEDLYLTVKRFVRENELEDNNINITGIIIEAEFTVIKYTQWNNRVLDEYEAKISNRRYLD